MNKLASWLCRFPSGFDFLHQAREDMESITPMRIKASEYRGEGRVGQSVAQFCLKLTMGRDKDSSKESLLGWFSHCWAQLMSKNLSSLERLCVHNKLYVYSSKPFRCDRSLHWEPLGACQMRLNLCLEPFLLVPFMISLCSLPVALLRNCRCRVYLMYSFCWGPCYSLTMWSYIYTKIRIK